mmetsp:Transcript_18193/g.32593  ORF Transcript_18193/g.32593 Transcript_18193/m.32593 type:complete len:128 (-) Transcript_18193:62-445(-)
MQVLGVTRITPSSSSSSIKTYGGRKRRKTVQNVHVDNNRDHVDTDESESTDELDHAEIETSWYSNSKNNAATASNTTTSSNNNSNTAAAVDVQCDGVRYSGTTSLVGVMAKQQREHDPKDEFLTRVA